MKWIKYQVKQCTVGEEDVLATKKVGYSEDNLTIAQSEAHNGQYEIIEDDTPPPKTEKIPTKVSELENDSKYVSEDNLQEVTDDILTQAKESGDFDGKDGSSPTISVSSISGGHRIEIKNVDGSVKTVDIMDGKDGDPYALTETDKNAIAAAVKALLKTESWTFTVKKDDGSTETVTKAVYVG